MKPVYRATLDLREAGVAGCQPLHVIPPYTTMQALAIERLEPRSSLFMSHSHSRKDSGQRGLDNHLTASCKDEQSSEVLPPPPAIYINVVSVQMV